MTTLPPLTAEQQSVASKILHWYDWGYDKDKPDFRLGGLAGSGKSTLIASLLHDGLDPGTQVCALSGKAASVLRSKGIAGASTYHSIFYRPIPLPGGGVRFDKRPTDELRSIPLLIVDEASMVNRQNMDDLLSYRIPILWVGDHGQLPPVGDDPGLMHPSNLDAKLETIHRQALSNPIIRYAHTIRTTGAPPPEPCPPHVNYCSISSIPWGSFPLSQILCSTNQQRHEYNRIFRIALDHDPKTPVPGDRVICLRNNRNLGLFNGEIYTVTHASSNKYTYNLNLADDEGRPHPDTIFAWRGGFGTSDPFPYDDLPEDTAHFDYAFACTVHKFQGSEAPHILYVETPCGAWSRNRHAYTAYTRAKETVTHATP